ncbi:MAG: succinate dehydrogenase/fumarate reductase iron-sulfur subunit [Anaerolineae bacterium]
MSANKQATVSIRRFNPDTDDKPYYQDYQVELTPGKTVLDALEEIKAEQDGSLTFRRSCRHAICGSCAMMVNRQNTLVCTKPLSAVIGEVGLFRKRNTVVIEPLPYLPIIKDLVVDRTVFWEQYEKIRPWLIAPDTVPEKEYRMSQEEVDAMESAETCIMCGACYSACPVVAGNKHYMGPHALLKAFMRIIDPRDQAPDDRLDMVATETGAFRCHKATNCIDACPKGLNPAKAISNLARASLRSGRLSAERAERLKTLIDEMDKSASAIDTREPTPQIMPHTIPIEEKA